MKNSFPHTCKTRRTVAPRGECNGGPLSSIRTHQSSMIEDQVEVSVVKIGGRHLSVPGRDAAHVDAQVPAACRVLGHDVLHLHFASRSLGLERMVLVNEHKRYVVGHETITQLTLTKAAAPGCSTARWMRSMSFCVFCSSIWRLRASRTARSSSHCILEDARTIC